MFCPSCGSKLENNVSFCYKCGEKIDKSNDDVSIPEQNSDAAAAPIQPHADEARYVKSPEHDSDEDNNIIALIGFILAFVSPVPGIVCSAIGLKNARTNGGVKYTFAKAGLIIGIVGTAVIVTTFLVLIITANVLLFHYLGVYQDLEHGSAVIQLLSQL